MKASTDNLKKIIKKVENKSNLFFSEANVIINHRDFECVNVSGFKKLNGNQILSEDISYIINDVKSKILEAENQKTIIHLFNTKFPNYISSDYENQFFAQKKYDITNIDEGDKSFHLIICFHVLEHILDDDKAIKELYRILKKNGVLIIQVPLK